ncbi:MAG: AraC family transcriptional regulator [Lachnospiraceae bacterium]|nr:AraC family transcriptional regulator [Lachnospiraceae bacterium]
MFKMLFQYIEENLNRKIDIDDAARSAGFSASHLHRLFTFAYGISVADYIRKRKLTNSLPILLDQRKSILEIAMACGFEYEQSFSRAFKAEFGITPGKYRMTRPILNITPPIHDFGYVCSNGLLFGPELVMFPEISLIGVEHDIPYRDSMWLCPKVALEFWDNQRQTIHGVANNHVFYGLTRHLGTEYSYSKYMTAVEGNCRNKIPEGMKVDSFGGYSCVKFHYIGRHHYREISQETAHDMYDAIHRYSKTDDPPSDIHLEKIDIDEFDGEYCLYEFYMPLKK